MVSEPVDFMGHLSIHAPSPKSAAGRDGRFTYPSPKSVGRDEVYFDKSLYRGDNPNLMNRFCKDELDLQFLYKLKFAERAPKQVE
ncbi:hypothetical protein MTR_3g074790 [Medicago truncatula]|uniref:Uncharacterized protein n=1 Tax=Medicago truncatula TaxID=3880 RepID=A0A072UYU9_MEDTR|nr:hypothetical protein MTR_3g074790 [Medicago truncatula]